MTVPEPIALLRSVAEKATSARLLPLLFTRKKGSVPKALLAVLLEM